MITGRSGGLSIEQVFDNLRPYMLEWKACFDLAQTPRARRTLNKWMRRMVWKRTRQLNWRPLSRLSFANTAHVDAVPGLLQLQYQHAGALDQRDGALDVHRLAQHLRGQA